MIHEHLLQEMHWVLGAPRHAVAAWLPTPVGVLRAPGWLHAFIMHAHPLREMRLC